MQAWMIISTDNLEPWNRPRLVICRTRGEAKHEAKNAVYTDALIVEMDTNEPLIVKELSPAQYIRVLPAPGHEHWEAAIRLWLDGWEHLD